MKFSVWYPENTTAAWSCTVGVADELEHMGHKVERVALKPPPARNTMPEIPALNKVDVVLMLGVEHYAGLLNGTYGVDGWKKVTAQKIAWYHESAFREDRNFITKETLIWADEHFFPAAQDAEFFDQEHFAQGRSHWLPFGVDWRMFNPGPVWTIDTIRAQNEKFQNEIYDVAFVGGLYPKRQAFLARLARHLDKKTVLECGNVIMQDLSGTLIRAQTKLYAENLRSVKVFFNLPALSQHQVTKVFEVMACGTFLLTPALDGAAVANMKLFEHKKHLWYYPEQHQGYIAQMLRDWPSEEKKDERQVIARNGMLEIIAKHTLEHRLKEMLNKIGRDGGGA